MRNELGHHSSMYILFLGYDRYKFISLTAFNVCMHINTPVNNVCKQTELFQSCLALVVALHRRVRFKIEKPQTHTTSNLEYRFC